ncbi:MAG: hypothetical protein J7578_20440, partial [Chitinophagaceae bacterium]|nr:hypothetical protein [Chitinophagaceae bacterium]
MKRPVLHIILIAAMGLAFNIAKSQSLIAERAGDNTYSLSAASIQFDPNDHLAVQTAAKLLQEDIFRITGQRPELNPSLSNGPLIIIGSADRSGIIKKLVAGKKINLTAINNRWEAFQLTSAKDPTGKRPSLVITGSDARGTAFGVFELSKQAGVSPWYWWADVPVKTRKE